MRIIALAGLFHLLLLSAPAQTADFDYLKIKRNKVRSVHAAKFEITLDRSFKFLGEFHHQPSYGKKQFNVSFAGFSDGRNLIMIHAETHTDGSGGLDYSTLAPASLNGVPFNSREQCATVEDEAELNANPQVQFIRSKGFDLSTPFYLKQFLATSADGKAEIVISYGSKLASCKDLTEDFRSQIVNQLNKIISVKRSE